TTSRQQFSILGLDFGSGSLRNANSRQHTWITTNQRGQLGGHAEPTEGVLTCHNVSPQRFELGDSGTRTLGRFRLLSLALSQITGLVSVVDLRRLRIERLLPAGSILRAGTLTTTLVGHHALNVFHRDGAGIALKQLLKLAL